MGAEERARERAGGASEVRLLCSGLGVVVLPQLKALFQQLGLVGLVHSALFKVADLSGGSKHKAREHASGVCVCGDSAGRRWD